MKKYLMLAVSVAAFFASCQNDDLASGKVQKPLDEADYKTVFTSTPNAGTRTSLSHDYNAGTAHFLWTNSDKIWIQNGGSYEQSSAVSFTRPTHTFGEFGFSNTYTAPKYLVYYTGNSSTATDVTIASSVTQSSPNNTDHLGTSGDCGIAEANMTSVGKYAFRLTHKAAYLCFVPKIENQVVNTIKVTKIKIKSDNQIAGDYTMPATVAGAITPKAGGTSSNEITVTLGASGFSLSGSENQAQNAVYAVIAPGTHHLTVEYTLKTTDTGEEGMYDQDLGTYTFAENSVTPVRALTVRDYDGTQYYACDAAEPFWKDHYWNQDGLQPTGKGDINTAFDYANYNTVWSSAKAPSSAIEGMGGTPDANGLTSGLAVNSLKGQPNMYEYVWYIYEGDPHYDSKAMWTIFNKAVVGGYWMKKQDKISGFSDNSFPSSAPAGIQYMGNGFGSDYVSLAQGRPVFSNRNDYFFIPATGAYANVGTVATPQYPSTANGLYPFNYSPTYGFDNGIGSAYVDPAYLPSGYKMDLVGLGRAALFYGDTKRYGNTVVALSLQPEGAYVEIDGNPMLWSPYNIYYLQKFE